MLWFGLAGHLPKFGSGFVVDSARLLTLRLDQPASLAPTDSVTMICQMLLIPHRQ